MPGRWFPRSVNRTLGAAGAVLGGLSATLLGERTSLLLVIGAFTLAFVVAVSSPLRTARDDDEPTL